MIGRAVYDVVVLRAEDRGRTVAGGMIGRAVYDVARACLLIIVLLLAAAQPARAQAADRTLDRIGNLIATGRFTEARNTLDRWERDHGDPRSGASAGDRARALYLRGILTGDAREAEDAFVRVVLSFPSSNVAPDALLRLGQGLLTGGEARRAVAYLERLRSDYPGAAARETGLLWLARAQLAAGMAAAACTTARDGAATAGTPQMRTLMELERDRACTATPPPPALQTVPPPQGVPQGVPQAPQAPPVQAGRDAATQPLAGRYAVQTGAYRELRSAENIARQMRDRGFDARVVLVGDSPLYRVRYGTFETGNEADAAATRIRNAGFAVIIVNDVEREIGRR
jgi:cell division septation protein DedD